jgi:hypothetical protein
MNIDILIFCLTVQIFIIIHCSYVYIYFLFVSYFIVKFENKQGRYKKNQAPHPSAEMELTEDGILAN